MAIVNYTFTNLIPDSSFENNQWSNGVYSTQEKLYGNRSLYFQTGTTVVGQLVIPYPVLGHKYYGRRYIKTAGNNSSADCRFEMYGGDGVGLNWVFAWNNGNHPTWSFDSAIQDITVINYASTQATYLRCFNVNTTADTWIDGVMLIDLTAACGAGREPSKEWCDENLPFFTDTYSAPIDMGDTIFLGEDYLTGIRLGDFPIEQCYLGSTKIFPVE